MKRFSLALCLVSCVFPWLILSPRARAQTATVGGRIVDPAEQVVSGAQVTALNTQTNASRVDVTDETGIFRFPNMVPGPYRLTVETPGFKTLHIDDLVLTVNQVFTFEAHLELGTVTTTTVVKASELPLIELESAQISNLVDSKRITELPLLTRDPYQLVLLSPGVAPSNTSNGGFSTNGTNERNNNFLLDGVDNNDTYVPGIPGGITALNPDSTQEFRVITNSFSAEYGRNNGAVIQIVTKSGSNDLHGDAYWFGRYNALGARDFFNPAATGPQNPYVRNDFGGSAGGPIKKDRLFWFANYEGQRFVTTLTGNSTVPTPEFKTGQFTVAGQPIDVSTPTSTNNAQGLPLDPTIQNILALYPNPNGPDVITGLSGTLFFPSASRQQLDEFTVKGDYNLTSKHVLMGRYLFNRFTDPNAFHTDFLPGGLGAAGTYQRTQAFVIGLTSTLTSRFINEFRFGGNRNDLQFNCGGVKTFDSFGFVDTYGRGADYFVPFGSSFAPGFGCIAFLDADSQVRYTGTYQTDDKMSYSRGHHLFKWGVEFRDVYENSYNDFGSRGVFDFSAYTNSGGAKQSLSLPSNSPLLDPANAATLAATENAVFALIGYVDFQTQSQFFNKQGTGTANDLRGFRQREWGLFVQDTWKLLPNLTANYGLRWEYFGVPFEAHNNLSQLFADPSGPAPFTFTIVGPGTGHTLYDNHYKNFEPRIGLAWDPLKDGKTSIRAGYGIFFNRVFGNLVGNARSSPPFQQAYLNNGILSQLTAPTVGTTSATLNDGAAFYAQLIDPNLKIPYSQNWNFGVQRAITSSLTIEVDYVGISGTDILRIVDANPPQPTLVSNLLAFCVPNNPLNTGFATQSGQCDTSTLQFGNLWFGAQNGVLPSNATHNNAFNQGGGAPGSALTKSIGRSSYNGLQVNIQQRLSHGIQIQGAYTFSHAIDNVNDPIAAAAGNLNFPHNTFDLAAERGNSDFDIRHRGVVNFIYEPNFGRGRDHLSKGFVGRLLEGWSLSGIIQAQTGHPYDIIGNQDSNHTGIAARGSIIDPRNLGQPPGTDKTFTGPAASAIGLTPFDVQPNIGKNEFYGPNYVNVDAAFLKNTKLTEKLNLQFRLEAYNLFNHTQFTNPDNLVQDIGTAANPGTFGQSLSTVTRADGTTSARQLQFALKLIF
jgi:hypothetical protein